METAREPARPSIRLPFEPRSWLRQYLRHRRARPVIAVLLILIALLALRVQHNRTAAAQAAWGEGRPVWVATGELPAGHVLVDRDVARRVLPRVAIPLDFVTTSPVGQRLQDDIAEGEIVRAGRLSASSSETGSLVGRGRGAVVLSGASHLKTGDRVDLYGLLSGEIVARDARVIRIADGSPVVSVDAAALPDVIRAFTTGDVLPVLTG